MTALLVTVSIAAAQIAPQPAAAPLARDTRTDVRPASISKSCVKGKQWLCQRERRQTFGRAARQSTTQELGFAADSRRSGLSNCWHEKDPWQRADQFGGGCVKSLPYLANKGAQK